MTGSLPRVLWIDTTGWYGGACRSMIEIVSRLHRSGKVEVAVALPEGPIYDKLRTIGIEVLPLSRVRPMHPKFSHPFITLRWPVDLEWAQSEVGEIANSWKPDIVHANSWAAAMAVPKGIPCIWHVRDYPKHPLPLNLAAKRAKRIIAISPAVETRLNELLSPALRGKIVRIDNGIDFAHTEEPLSKDEARKALGLPGKGIVIGMAAYYAPWKRHDLFLETARLFSDPKAPVPGPKAIWAIAGDDNHHEQPAYAAKIRKLADSLGDRVRLLGHLPPGHFLPAIDLLVHPAQNEPFGRIICEAMAFGVPVVAHDSGGPASILGHGDCGRLVDEDTPKAFARAITETFQEPPQKRRARIQKAKMVVERDYNIERVVETLKAHYAEWTART